MLDVLFKDASRRDRRDGRRDVGARRRSELRVVRIALRRVASGGYDVNMDDGTYAADPVSADKGKDGGSTTASAWIIQVEGDRTGVPRFVPDAFSSEVCKVEFASSTPFRKLSSAAFSNIGGKSARKSSPILAKDEEQYDSCVRRDERAGESVI